MRGERNVWRQGDREEGEDLLGMLEEAKAAEFVIGDGIDVRGER